ncbi:MAG: hypothetical protein ABIU87_09475 [Ornithinibacter sp.]
MSQTTSAAAGTSRSGLILLGVSVLVGLGMSFAAASTIVSANGPQDGTAITDGQASVVPADILLNYGG